MDEDNENGENTNVSTVGKAILVVRFEEWIARKLGASILVEKGHLLTIEVNVFDTN